jgi:hypothetical protein
MHKYRDISAEAKLDTNREEKKRKGKNRISI